MMNWYQQSQDMMKSWMDIQQQMMNAMTQSATTPNTPSDNWDQTLQSWENAFKNAMETQALLTRMWARNMTVGLSADAAQAFTSSIEQMSNTWSEMQSLMLSNWFKVLKSMNPSSLEEQSTTAMKQWQESMQQMMQMQNEWAQKWSETVNKNDQ